MASKIDPGATCARRAGRRPRDVCSIQLRKGEISGAKSNLSLHPHLHTLIDQVSSSSSSSAPEVGKSSDARLKRRRKRNMFGSIGPRWKKFDPTAGQARIPPMCGVPRRAIARAT